MYRLTRGFLNPKERAPCNGTRSTCVFGTDHSDDMERSLDILGMLGQESVYSAMSGNVSLVLARWQIHLSQGQVSKSWVVYHS